MTEQQTLDFKQEKPTDLSKQRNTYYEQFEQDKQNSTIQKIRKVWKHNKKIYYLLTTKNDLYKLTRRYCYYIKDCTPIIDQDIKP